MRYGGDGRRGGETFKCRACGPAIESPSILCAHTPAPHLCASLLGTNFRIPMDTFDFSVPFFHPDWFSLQRK